MEGQRRADAFGAGDAPTGGFTSFDLAPVARAGRAQPAAPQMDPREEQMAYDVLAATLVIVWWVALGSVVLAIAEGLGSHPARRVLLGLVLVAGSSAAVRRRRAVHRRLRARPELVVGVGLAQLAVATLDGLVNGPYVACTVTAVVLAVVVARARTVWLLVVLLCAGFSLGVLLQTSPQQLVQHRELGGVVAALVSYPSGAVVLLGLRHMYLRYVASVPTILAAMRGGRLVVTPALSGAIDRALRLPSAEPTQPSEAAVASAARAARAATLTARERQVVEGLAGGRAPKELARLRGVSLNTVRTHIRNAKHKTGARTLRELAALAALPEWFGAGDDRA